MADYNDASLGRTDALHHVEGLNSLGDRLARRKDQQRRRKRKTNNPPPSADPVEQEEPSSTGTGTVAKGHIDYRA